MPQQISKLILAAFFSLFGLGAVVIGVTILPFFGLFLAVPLFGLAYYFFRAHLSRQCEIS